MLTKLLPKRKTIRSTHIQCPSCDESSSVDEWNKIAIDTYGSHSPDVRTAALNKKVSFPYQCPKCYRGFSAYLLTFVEKK